MESLTAEPDAGASLTTGRLTFLDCVRGIAALSVLLEHGGYRLSPGFRGFTHGIFSFGKFGVAAFFLTSGFVIPSSLERGGSLKRFWVSRGFRLYPLYWLSIAVVLCLHLLHVPYAVSPEFAQHLSRNALVNLTMLQGFIGFPNAEGLYYTLAMEMGFYIFVSVLYRVKMNHRSLPLAWLGCGGLALFGTLVPVVFRQRVPLAGLFYLLCLLLGTAVYRHFTEEASTRMIAALLGCVALTTMVEVYCNYVLVKKDDTLEHYTLWAVFLPWAGAYSLFLGAYVFRRHHFPKVLGWLGAVSYSVYLLHPPMASLVPAWPNRTCSFLVMLALTLAVASATYRWVELPFISLGKQLKCRLEKPAPEQDEVWRKRAASGMADRKPKAEAQQLA
jgi:peptidoglycan/LPS O-acetylase OafA/YrhL